MISKIFYHFICSRNGAYYWLIYLNTSYTFSYNYCSIKNNENEDKIKILITIYGVYFANTIYIFIYTFSGARLYNIPLKYTLIQFMIMLFIIVILCLIIKRIGSKKKRNKELSSSEIRFRMILIISTLLTVMIASIYIFTCTSIINNEKISFIMGNFVPEALPLISIILTSIIVYYYDKSVEYRVKLRREIEEKSNRRIFPYYRRYV